jgi:hypothetical protein
MQKTACTANKNVFRTFSLFTKNRQDAMGCKVKYGEVCFMRKSMIPNPSNFAIFLTVCGTAQTRISPYKYCTEAESKEKHGVWDPMPELTITSPYVYSNTFTMNNPMPESTLSAQPRTL